MNGQPKYRLGDVLGLEDECGAVDPIEVEDLMEGTAEPSRLAEIEAQTRGGFLSSLLRRLPRRR